MAAKNMDSLGEMRSEERGSSAKYRRMMGSSVENRKRGVIRRYIGTRMEEDVLRAPRLVTYGESRRGCPGHVTCTIQRSSGTL